MTKDDLLRVAWTIIANANGGDWDKATPEWREAAERWHDQYHDQLPTIETMREMPLEPVSDNEIDNRLA